MPPRLPIARLTTALALACLGAASATARGQAASAATPTPVLVELFTSEGCSSCPPADALLIDLLATQPIANVRIIGMSEHVDYWNNLGWTDPFSAASFTSRQSMYAAKLGSTVYTPQVVIDGRAEMVGSDRSEVLAAIRASAARPKPGIQLAWNADRSAVEITLGEDATLAKARVQLAIIEDGLRSQVKRGENEGRELAHAAVTRSLQPIGEAGPLGSFHRVVPVAFDPAWKPNALHVVVFAANDKTGVGAVSVLDRR